MYLLFHPFYIRTSFNFCLTALQKSELDFHINHVIFFCSKLFCQQQKEKQKIITVYTVILVNYGIFYFIISTEGICPHLYQFSLLIAGSWMGSLQLLYRIVFILRVTYIHVLNIIMYIFNSFFSSNAFFSSPSE